MQKLNNVLKYIENEKDISRCKISILESISSLSPSKKRILEMEKRFVNFPFECLNLSTREEADGAIVLYKTYRGLFNKKYSIKDYISAEASNEFKVSLLRDNFISVYNKVAYLQALSLRLTTSRLEEINPVQDQFFFEELQLYMKEDMDGLSIDDLLRLEPSFVAKKRAKVQVILLSIGLFVKDEVSKVIENDLFNIIIDSKGDLGSLNFIPDYDFYCSVISANESLDCIVDDIDNNIFKFYNNSVDMLRQCLSGTMGYNKYLRKLHKLSNLFDVADIGKAKFPIIVNNISINSIGISNLSSHTSNSKLSYGIMLPFKRIGNERMFPFYYKIFSSGVDISSLFYNKFFNVQCVSSDKSKNYYKAMAIRPKREIDILRGASLSIDSAMNLISCICDNNYNKNNDGKNILNSMEKNGNFIPIDIDNSYIYISKTRTDGEMIFSAMKNVVKRLDVIKNDYFCIESSYDLLIANNIRHRKNKIFSYKS